MPELTDVLITNETAKLPPELAGLIDVARPVPPDVVFFEKRVSPTTLVTTIGWAAGWSVVGACCIFFGFATLQKQGVYHSSKYEYLPIFFGFTCLCAAWMMIGSLRRRWQAIELQRAGKPTRLGIFLTPAVILEVNEFGYCAVPRSRFVGLSDGCVKYTLRDQEKSYRLPKLLMNGDPMSLAAAIQTWSAATKK